MQAASVLTPVAAETAPLDVVTFDLYRDIHKGLRKGLFDLTLAAGSVDPGDREAVTEVASRWHELTEILVSHAEHEDEHVQPHIRRAAPGLADRIDREHPALEGQMARLGILADRAADAARVELRAATHRFYLGLSTFTADYLHHQSFEEFEVGPALATTFSIDELLTIHVSITSSIPPEDMARGLALMLPAQNVEDRTELLGGMQAGAPPEVFAGVLGLAESVLTRADYRGVATRLGV